MDFYGLLGVEVNATETQIRDAYRKLAFSTHPDRNPGDKDAEKRFKEIQEAYETLIDTSKRARYNAQKPVNKPYKPPQKRKEHFTFYDAPPPSVDLWGNPLNVKQKEEWSKNNRTPITKIHNERKVNDSGFVDVFKYENSGTPNIRR